MKTGLLLGLVGSAYGLTQEIDVASWDQVYTELNGCMLSMGSCGYITDSFSGFTALFTQDSCENSGLKWWSAFPDSAAFKEASDIVHNDPAAKIYIGRMKAGATWDSLESELSGTGVIQTDLMHCRVSGRNFILLDGITSDVTADSLDFLAAMPPILKRSPNLQAFNKTKTNTVRVRLSPQNIGNEDSVMSRLAESHSNGPRILSNGEQHVLRVYKARRTLQGAAKGHETFTVETNNLDDIVTLEQAPESIWVEVQPQMEERNIDAFMLMQGGAHLDGFDFTVKSEPEYAPIWAKGITGEGEIVGVGDSGMDMEHCMFTDPSVDEAARKLERNQNETRYDYPGHRKVVQYFSWSDGDAGTVSDHGTHVGATIAGSLPAEFGNPDTNLEKAEGYQGMAPNAKMAFFDMQPVDVPRAIFPPDDLADMFSPAYEIGARIHSNSWGDVMNVYDAMAKSLDRYAFTHQDMLPVFAAGNAGPAQFSTVGTPATAKNTLIVGASRNSVRSLNQYKIYRNRSQVPWECQTENCVDDMAFFSSQGPSYDGTMKPDVSAPGFFIFSAQSQVSGPSCDQTSMAGTSMATPATAGGATLIREFLKKEKGLVNPMGALVKAALIDSSVLMTGFYSSIDLDGFPSRYQGFGRVQLNNTLVFEETPTRKVFFAGDTPNMPTLAESGDSKTFTATAKVGSTIKATLVWFDAPASELASQGLVNDLDLTIVGPDGNLYLPRGIGPAPTFDTNFVGVNRVDTTEQVVIESAPYDGDYKIVVTGHEIIRGPQPYAIVISVVNEAADEQCTDISRLCPSVSWFCWSSTVKRYCAESCGACDIDINKPDTPPPQEAKTTPAGVYAGIGAAGFLVAGVAVVAVVRRRRNRASPVQENSSINAPGEMSVTTVNPQYDF